MERAAIRGCSSKETGMLYKSRFRVKIVDETILHVLVRQEQPKEVLHVEDEEISTWLSIDHLGRQIEV